MLKTTQLKEVWKNLRRLFDSALFRAKLGKFSTKKPPRH